MKKKPYRIVLYYLLLGSRWVFSLLPYRLGFSFGGTIGKIAFFFLAKERNKTLGHLRLAFGDERSEKELKVLGRAVFEHYGKIMAELALIGKLLPRLDEFVSAQGYEHFDSALKKGKGVVVVIAHFGNWEIMGGYTALKGYPCTVIARRIYYEKYDELLVNFRERMKVETVYRDQSPRVMLSVLKKNRLLGFVVDQDVETVDGVFADFFGRPAFTPTAPVRFAISSGAPIIPVFIIREGMKHKMIVEPAIDLQVSDDRENDVRVNTQKWVSIQEKYIRRYPHLWVWNHKRWKTQPSAKLVN